MHSFDATVVEFNSDISEILRRSLIHVTMSLRFHCSRIYLDRAKDDGRSGSGIFRRHLKSFCLRRLRSVIL